MSHLVVVTPGFPADEADTSCIPALQIYLSHLSLAGLWTISVVALHYPYQKREYEWKGIKVHALGGKNRRLGRMMNHQRAKRVIRQLDQDIKVTLLHSYWLGECAEICMTLADELRVSHVCTAMGQDVRLGNRSLGRLPKDLPIITLSKFHAQQLLKNYNRKSTVIHFGVDDLSMPKGLKEYDIVGAGSLIKLKDYNYFVEIVRQVIRVRPAAKCLLIGDGPERTKLERSINKSGLQAHITLMGQLDRYRTLQLIRASKILLHPSIFESFGMVIIEALALGTWVAARKVGIADEISQVYLIDQEDALVAQLTAWIDASNEPKPLFFDVAKTVKDHQGLYQSLL